MGAECLRDSSILGLAMPDSIRPMGLQSKREKTLENFVKALDIGSQWDYSNGHGSHRRNGPDHGLHPLPSPRQEVWKGPEGKPALPLSHLPEDVLDAA
jgi:hypothetical protein